MLRPSLTYPGELLPEGELRLLRPGGGVGLSSMSRLDLESQEEGMHLGLELIE